VIMPCSKKVVSCSCLNPLVYATPSGEVCCQCWYLPPPSSTTSIPSPSSFSWEIPALPALDGQIRVEGNYTFCYPTQVLEVKGGIISIAKSAISDIWAALPLNYDSSLILSPYMGIELTIPFPFEIVMTSIVSGKIYLDREYCFFAPVGEVKDGWFTIWIPNAKYNTGVSVSIKSDGLKLSIVFQVDYEFPWFALPLPPLVELPRMVFTTVIEAMRISDTSTLIIRGTGNATATISTIDLMLYNKGVLSERELLLPRSKSIQVEYAANFLPDGVESFSDLNADLIAATLYNGSGVEFGKKGKFSEAYNEPAIGISAFSTCTKGKSIKFSIRGKAYYPYEDGGWVGWNTTVAKAESFSAAPAVKTGGSDVWSWDSSFFACGEEEEIADFSAKERTWIGVSVEAFFCTEKTRVEQKLSFSTIEDTIISPHLSAAEKTLSISSYRYTEKTIIQPQIVVAERTLRVISFSAKERDWKTSFIESSEKVKKTGVFFAGESAIVKPYLSALEKTAKQYWFVAKERTTKINWWIDDLPEYYRYYGVIVEN